METAKLKGLPTRNPEKRQTMAGRLLDSALPLWLTCEEGSFRIRKSANP